mmetsp:Transcript_6511/g.24281  ORF Transcript_6511/g.24281 Transcript_6511/m.24281 type:complete len:488 (-) Transcript_6511:2104-3567(-)
MAIQALIWAATLVLQAHLTSRGLQPVHAHVALPLEAERGGTLLTRLASDAGGHLAVVLRARGAARLGPLHAARVVAGDPGANAGTLGVASAAAHRALAKVHLILVRALHPARLAFTLQAALRHAEGGAAPGGRACRGLLLQGSVEPLEAQVVQLQPPVEGRWEEPRARRRAASRLGGPRGRRRPPEPPRLAARLGLAASHVTGRRLSDVPSFRRNLGGADLCRRLRACHALGIAHRRVVVALVIQHHGIEGVHAVHVVHVHPIHHSAAAVDRVLFRNACFHHRVDARLAARRNLSRAISRAGRALALPRLLGHAFALALGATALAGLHVVVAAIVLALRAHLLVVLGKAITGHPASAHHVHHLVPRRPTHGGAALLRESTIDAAEFRARHTVPARVQALRVLELEPGLGPVALLRLLTLCLRLGGPGALAPALAAGLLEAVLGLDMPADVLLLGFGGQLRHPSLFGLQAHRVLEVVGDERWGAGVLE